MLGTSTGVRTDTALSRTHSLDHLSLYATPSASAADHEQPICVPEEYPYGRVLHPSNEPMHNETLKPPFVVKRKQKRFLRLFPNIDSKEQLVCRFSCAYVSDKGALLQGHLYVSPHWICFYSNILGYKKSISVPFTSVQAISKERTARIFPNAVGVRTLTQLYVFGSLISRDNTFHLLDNFFERCKSAESDGDSREPRPKLEIDNGGLRQDYGEALFRGSSYSSNEELNEPAHDTGCYEELKATLLQPALVETQPAVVVQQLPEHSPDSKRQIEGVVVIIVLGFVCYVLLILALCLSTIDSTQRIIAHSERIRELTNKGNTAPK